MRGYGVFSLIYLAFCFIFTKVFFRPARLIRLPISLRNRSLIEIGRGFTTGVGCRLDSFSTPDFVSGAKLKIGHNVQINDYVHIAAVKSVLIGDDVLIASKVFISDHNHGSYDGDAQTAPNTAPASRPLFVKPVVISSRVWIGEFVSILPGVTVGEGSVIGSNSVVTRSIPEYSIAVGSPAKVVKKYNFDKNKWERV